MRVANRRRTALRHQCTAVFRYRATEYLQKKMLMVDHNPSSTRTTSEIRESSDDEDDDDARR